MEHNVDAHIVHEGLNHLAQAVGLLVVGRVGVVLRAGGQTASALPLPWLRAFLVQKAPSGSLMHPSRLFHAGVQGSWARCRCGAVHAADFRHP